MGEIRGEGPCGQYISKRKKEREEGRGQLDPDTARGWLGSPLFRRVDERSDVPSRVGVELASTLAGFIEMYWPLWPPAEIAKIEKATTDMAPMQFEIGDRLRLRKPHPCGNYDWVVVRLGGDIGLCCEKCGRRVLLPRSEVERRTKQILPRLPKTEADENAEP